MWSLKCFAVQPLPCATETEKPLEGFVENNYHQRRKISGNCFSSLSTGFLPSSADAEYPPPNTPIRALNKTALQMLHVTEFSPHMPLFW